MTLVLLHVYKSCRTRRDLQLLYILYSAWGPGLRRAWRPYSDTPCTKTLIHQKSAQKWSKIALGGQITPKIGIFSIFVAGPPPKFCQIRTPRTRFGYTHHFPYHLTAKTGPGSKKPKKTKFTKKSFFFVAGPPKNFFEFQTYGVDLLCEKLNSRGVWMRK